MSDDDKDEYQPILLFSSALVGIIQDCVSGY